MAPLVDCLPNMYEALGLIPSTIAHSCNGSTPDSEAGDLTPPCPV